MKYAHKVMCLAAVLIALLALFAVQSAHAQVVVKFTPEPMAVPIAMASGARDMGRWLIEVCNDGQSSATLTPERISMAAPNLRFVDQDDATLVLLGHQKKTFWAYLEQYGPLALQALALGKAYQGTQTAADSRAAARWAAGLSTASFFLPPVLDMLRGAAPVIPALPPPLKYPVTLGPGQCFSDHRFAAKTKHPQPVITAIR